MKLFFLMPGSGKGLHLRGHQWMGFGVITSKQMFKQFIKNKTNNKLTAYHKSDSRK